MTAPTNAPRFSGLPPQQALARVLDFLGSNPIRYRIQELEEGARVAGPEEARKFVDAAGVDLALLVAARSLKEAFGQLNVAIHAAGILLALPYVLEPAERVHYVSLGAGNTGRTFDLETDRRVAEFKLIRWQGGADAGRQDSLFKDVFKLAGDMTERRKQLYVLEKQHPLRFLENRRAITSVLRNATDRARFQERHPSVRVVREYWDLVRDRVEIVDLMDVAPSVYGNWAPLQQGGDELA